MARPQTTQPGGVRKCSRNGCRWPASASLTFAYAQKVVWIEDLIVQPHPAAYDLCAAHADRLTVPRGWEVVRLPAGPAEQEADDLEALANAVREVLDAR